MPDPSRESIGRRIDPPARTDAVGRPARAQPPGQAQRDLDRAARRARRGDRRRRAGSARPGRCDRRRRPGILRRLRSCRGVRRGCLGLARDARPRHRRDPGHLALLEAGHRPGPRLRPGRRPRAGDGLRPDRGGRRCAARRARDPLRLGAGYAADAVPDRPEGHPRAALHRRPRSTRPRPSGSAWSTGWSRPTGWRPRSTRWPTRSPGSSRT